MKWTEDHGTYYLEGGRWLLQPVEDWSQFWQSCNWYTFRPIMLEIENDAHLGGFEVTLVVLGIGFRWRWNYTETEKMTEIKRTIEGIRSGEIETTELPPLGDSRRP